MTGRPGRAGAEWRRVRHLVLAGATHCGMPDCRFPGVPLDPDDKIACPAHQSGWRPGPTYPSVDHVIPVSLTQGWSDEERRSALHDPAYLVPAHMGCNAARGNRRYGRSRRQPERPTRDWGLQ